MAHYCNRFCRRQPWSDFIGEVKSGGGSLASAQRHSDSYVNLQGDVLPQAETFYIGRVKNLRFW